MKKIILITNKKKFDGGANVAAKRLIDALKKNFRIEVRFINEKNLIGKFKYYIARIIVRLFIGKTSFLNSLNIFSRISLKDIKADLVLVNWIGQETISIKDLSRINKPIIWVMHDMFASTSTEHFLNLPKKNGYFKRDTQNNLIKKIIYNKKKILFDGNINIIANSNWLEKFCRKSDLTKKLNVKKIYNPIDAEKWFREKEKYSKQQLNLDPNKKYILYGAQGGFKNYRKGGDLFEDSINKLGKIDKNLEVIVLGADQNQIKKIHNINFHFREVELDTKIQRLYHSSSILTVSAARAESLPQFIVETILCKNPVVSFDVGGIREIVSHKFNGYLTKCYDTGDFAMGMKYCIKNIKKNNLLKSRKNIYKMFENKSISKEYTNFINKII